MRLRQCTAMRMNFVESTRPRRICKDGLVRLRMKIAMTAIFGRKHNDGIAAVALDMSMVACVQASPVRQLHPQLGRIGEHPIHIFRLIG